MKIIKFLVLCFFSYFSVSLFASPNADVVSSLPGFGVVKQLQYAGYVSAGYQQNMFYWFVAKNKNYQKAPIIIWTSGGPGASSLYGFFLENGPYQVHHDEKLTPNPEGWNKFANYLVFDQPMGVGLSFAEQKNYPKTPEQGNEEFYQALRSFLNKHPELKNNPIYLSGESYAGTYIALLSEKILQENQTQVKNKINLKGVILISAWVDPVLQESTDADFAFYHGLINVAQKQRVDKLYQQCLSEAKKHGDNAIITNTVCSKVGNTIGELTQLPDMHDVASTTVVSDAAMVNYLNNSKVRQSIHAGLSGKYQTMTDIWDNYAAEEQNSVVKIYDQLLKHHERVLVFSGLDDGSDCNSLGAQKWLQQLRFRGDSQFWSQSVRPWRLTAKGQVLGYVQHAGDLTWVRVLRAGHMVPISQPKIDVLVRQFLSA